MICLVVDFVVVVWDLFFFNLKVTMMNTINFTD